MYLFSLTEQVRPGIIVNRDDGASVTTPPFCSMILMLGQELADFVEKLPPGVPWLKRAAATFNANVLVLKPERGRTQQAQALVHIQTAGGAGGRVFMSSNVYTEKLERGAVVQQYEQFPPVGIEPLCKSEYADQLLFEGVEMLDLLVIMNPGSSFRLRRTGNLRDQHGTQASPLMFVRWNGHDLRCTRPRKFDFASSQRFVEATA